MNDATRSGPRGISLDDVRQVLDEWHEAGKGKPSQAAIRRALGGTGSFSTITKHLATLETERVLAERTVPPDHELQPLLSALLALDTSVRTTHANWLDDELARAQTALDEQLAAAALAQSKAEAATVDAEIRLEERAQHLKHMEAANSALSAEHAKLRKSQDALQAALSQAEQSRTHSEAIREGLIERLADRDQQISTLTQQLEHTQARLDTHESLLATKHAELAASREAYVAIEHDRDTAAREIKFLNQSMVEAAAQYERERDQLNTALTHAQKIAEQYASERNAAREKSIRLEETLRSLQDRLDQLKQENTQLSSND